MAFCQKCGTQITQPGACPSCNPQQAGVCQRCGSKSIKAGNFCNNCGMDASSNAAVQGMGAQSAQIGNILLIVFVFLAAVALAACVYFEVFTDKAIELYVTVGLIVVSLITFFAIVRSKKIKSAYKTLVVFAVLISVACLVFSVGQSDEDIIAHRLHTFTEAANNGDLDGLIDCFDSTTRATLRAATGVGNLLLGGFTGNSLNVADLFAMAIGYGHSIAEYDIAFEVTVHSVDVRNTSEATANVTFRMDNIVQNISIPMKKDGFNWYINLSGLFR